MKKHYFLGIDEGTTGTTAILFDENFRPAGQGYREITQHFPTPGQSEHDAEEIFRAVLDAVSQAIKQAGATPADIVSVGIDHEGESVLFFDGDTGRPLSPVIVWQDRRTTAEALTLEKQYGDFFRARTGLSPDSYFSATKIAYLYGQGVCNGVAHPYAANLDAFLLYRLTGGTAFATDASTASRTMLMNIQTGQWDPEILALLKLDRIILPEIRDCAAPFGMTDPDVFLGIRAPVCGLLTDQQAALFGQGCHKPGTVKTTYGTGCFMLMNTGDRVIRSSHGLIPTVAWQLNGKRTYALDGGIYTAGAAIQWLRDNLGLLSFAKEAGEMAIRAGHNGGIYFVPAFHGLSAPYRDPSAAGMIIGLTGGTTREQIVRAASESIAYQVSDLLSAMTADSGCSLSVLRCDGGAAGDEFLMQFQSDILGLPVEVPFFREATCLGAALMGAVGANLAEPDAPAGLLSERRQYTPKMSADARESLLADWHRALVRAGNWRQTT